MIVVKGLSKQFKGQTVLNGIDLTVQPGEVVAIIGPSGSGKTTFLRCLNLLETPDAGQIQIGAISIDANRPLGGQQSAIRRLRQQAGFVFQNFNLFPHRTALENVIEGPVIVKKTPRDQAVALGRKLLAKVGLAGKEDAYPELVGEVLATIRGLAEEKRTMIIVTHEMSFARDVANRVIFFDKGVIVEQGEAKALFAAPKEERTRQFLRKFLGTAATE